MKTASALVSASMLFSVLIAGSARAGGPESGPSATGSVGLGSPLQYAEFEVFHGGTGHVRYTNFEFAAPGSDVWVPASASTIKFNYQGPDYLHTFTLDSFTPLSTTSVGFTGTGYYDPDHGYTWNLHGVIHGDDVWFQILYTGTQAGCKLSAHGEIDSSGAMSGTWSGNCWSGINAWSTGAGAAYEVFSYKAHVTCTSIDGINANATFGFTIPNGVPLAGTPVVVHVHDGGSPGALYDTWAHGVDLAPGACTGSVSPYPITSGNLVVHSRHDKDHDDHHDHYDHYDHHRDDH